MRDKDIDDATADDSSFSWSWSRLVAEVKKDLGKSGEMKEMVIERWSFDRINAFKVK